MFDKLLGDIRFALRTFAKAPTFTAAVLATIALAVGATASLFAVVDGILLRPLPFPGSDRTVMLCETNASIGHWCGASPMNVADWARSSSSLEAAGVARRESFVGRNGGESYDVAGAIASPGFFRALSLRPALGRAIEERDMPRGANHVILLAHGFWQQRLGGDPAVVGRQVVLDDKPFTVIGVLPADAYLPGPEYADVEVWKPLTASIDDVEDRRWRGFVAIGRRTPGTSDAALFAELSGIRSQLARAYPDANKDWGLRLVGLREALVGDARPSLLVFLGAVGFVLLIACANVASLLLVRATGRGLEFALRASLGAGRRQLVQQLVTESLVLALAGGALGLLLAAWTTTAFVAVAPSSIPRLDEVVVDGRVALFAVLVSVVAALIFGLAPAVHAARANLNDTLKGMRTTGRTPSRLRPAFVVVQLSLALMLLFGAGLLARGFARLLDWRPGFDRANLVTAWMSPAANGTRNAVAEMERIRDEVAALPGIRSAALCSAGPLFGGEETGGLAIEGRPAFAPQDMPTVQWFDVGPHYFETLGVRLLRGRGFSKSDAAGAPHVGIINQSLARRFFPGENPIGRQVTVNDHPSEIVGVVADVRPLQPDRPTPPQIYWPIQQYPRLGATLLLRVTPGATNVEKTVRDRIAAVNPRVQLSALTSIDERLEKQLVRPRFNVLLIAGFALIAVLLAVVGVYGVIAHGVASRSRELAVRVALGATPRALVASVVGQGLRLAAIGIAAGCAGALAVGQLLKSLLYGLPARDALTLAGAAALLAIAAAAACWLPARRASRVDPISALRAQ